MKKQFLIFLIFSTTLLCLISCSDTSTRKSTYKSIKEILSQQNIDIETLSSILIIADGECASCNAKFVEICENYINDDNKLIILNTKGLAYDISTLLNANNVLHFESINQDILNKSQVITLFNNRIDTLIEINTTNIPSCILSIE